MSDTPSTGPKRIGDLLGFIMAKYGYAQSASRVELERAWEEVVDLRIRERTRLGPIRRGVLEVAVDSGSLLADLEGFHKHEILERLQQKMGLSAVKGIKFRRL
jgi:predicted nucleic acid-binding Zn ribbon protein